MPASAILSGPIRLLTSGASARDWWLLRAALERAGVFSGDALLVAFRANLRGTRRGDLAQPDRGFPVHGASDIPRRTILLHAALKRHPQDARRILLHELFHFVWVRLGNPARWAWEEVLTNEIRSQATGELGWSAEALKRALTSSDLRSRSRRWRNYCAESFCDSAAWIRGGAPAHDEVTLPPRWREQRKDWWTRRFPAASFRI